MVSVIVPIYNVEHYLKRCVDSILAQTYKNLQIILVNDGSPDSSLDICECYAKKDQRIVVIDKENGGLSSARNAGLKVANGNYIVFVDSDDWLDKEYVERLRRVIIETESDMSACLFCRVKNEEGKRKHFNESPIIITDKKYFSVFSEESYSGYACNKMFKREIIKQNNLIFDETIFNGEDFPFTLEYVYYAKKTVFIEQDLYFYFFRETGIMNTIKLNERFITIVDAREKAMMLLKKYAPDCYDVCKASYLSILSKIKYMSMIDLRKHRNIYDKVNLKIRKEKKGLLFLKNVALKTKIKLFIMIYFPKMSFRAYKKKVKIQA